MKPALLPECGTAAVDGVLASPRLRALEREIRRLRSKLAMSERALSQGEKLQALGQLISGVAHEMANPLTAIVTRAALIRSMSSLEDAKAQAEIIEEQAQRATKIVRNLSAFTRRRAATRAAVVLNDIVRAVVELHGYQLTASNIELVEDLAEDCPAVEADAHELEQVLLNLVMNAQYAIAHSRGEGRVVIRTSATHEDVRLTIEDDGPGIPADVLPHVFEPFFTTKGENGSGLGLAIAHDLLARHGGRIRAETTQGRGTTMIIELPRLREPRQADTRGRQPTAPLRRGRLLIVDDEAEVADLIASLLRRRGYDVEYVTSADAALTKLRIEEFHAVLTDVRMPEMRGDELWHALQREHPHLAQRTVFMTGDHGARETVDIVEATGVPCLTKPFRADELDEVLSKLDPSD